MPYYNLYCDICIISSITCQFICLATVINRPKAETIRRHSGRINSTTPLFHHKTGAQHLSSGVRKAAMTDSMVNQVNVFVIFGLLNEHRKVTTSRKENRSCFHYSSTISTFKYHRISHAQSNKVCVLAGRKNMLTHPTCRETPMPSSSLSCC